MLNIFADALLIATRLGRNAQDYLPHHYPRRSPREFQDDAALRGRPGKGVRHLPVALDLFDELLGHTEVEQAPVSADDAGRLRPAIGR